MNKQEHKEFREKLKYEFLNESKFVDLTRYQKANTIRVPSGMPDPRCEITDWFLDRFEEELMRVNEEVRKEAGGIQPKPSFDSFLVEHEVTHVAFDQGFYSGRGEMETLINSLINKLIG